jgi:hypothetical protein
MAIMKKNRNYIILFLITLAAAFLRFYKLGDFSLSNDELSALNRLQFSNFHDLITKGVMPDFHPALVQVFLIAFYTLGNCLCSLGLSAWKTLV